MTNPSWQVLINPTLTKHTFEPKTRMGGKPGKPLGEGGFGKVYETVGNRDGYDDFEMALKIIPLPDEDSPLYKYVINEARSMSVTYLLYKQAPLLSQLRHENVVTLYDFERTSKEVKIYMELCDNSLYNYIKERRARRVGFLPFDCWNTLCQLASGLEYLHENNVIHRDIKPGNILFSYGVAKLGDFGLAAVLGEDLFAKSIVGTRGYIAPEGNHTKEDDVYALALCIYEMETLQMYTPGSPFPESELGVVLSQMLHKDRDARIKLEEVKRIADEQRKKDLRYKNDIYIKRMNEYLERTKNVEEAVLKVDEERNQLELDFRRKHIELDHAFEKEKLELAQRSSSLTKEKDNLFGDRKAIREQEKELRRLKRTVPDVLTDGDIPALPPSPRGQNYRAYNKYYY